MRAALFDLKDLICSIGKWGFLSLLVLGCCPKDPSCRGATSLSPGYFWKPTEDYYRLPCDYDLSQDEDLRAAIEQIQKHRVEVADLIDVALQNNPTTQMTWANARAAAFGVEIAKSALYPSIILNEDLNYTSAQLDDGPPDVISATSATGTAAATTAATTAGAAGSPPNQVNLLNAVSRSKAIRAQVLNNGQGNAQTGVTGTGAGAGGTTTAAVATATTFTPPTGTTKTLTSDLTVSYLLLDFGGREASIEAAKQALYNSNWTHNRQVQQVILSVLQNYYTYKGLDALLKARQSDLKNAQENYESAKALFDAGIRTIVDVLQAQSDLINIELSIVQIEGQKEVAYGNLANALGLPADTRFNTPDIPKDLPLDVVSANVNQLIDQAMKRRPDLAAAYALHEQRKKEVIVARSSGLPTLGSLINLEENNDLMNPSFNNHSLSASLIVSAPLFNGFYYMNLERQAKEVLRGACANLRNVEIGVTLDVVTSYYNFKTAVKSVKFSQEYLKYSQESYEAAFITYREGISTILDLLNAQRSLANAKAQLIQARTNWAIALSNISFAVGTLGTGEEIKPLKQKIK
ncbi:TolC family protein [Candidatus Protochlamydia phocaeensis]|uniref:TolC family protein n=1 Tax=Candidatus Protochlamydia phocaeensis TaxID=1414722 RepID=UPI0008395682|nr:TolC family protein [Candidatus Protochlamydia phocaeensis]